MLRGVKRNLAHLGCPILVSSLLLILILEIGISITLYALRRSETTYYSTLSQTYIRTLQHIYNYNYNYNYNYSYIYLIYPSYT